MPVKRRLLQDYSLNYVTAHYPFDLSELVKSAEEDLGDTRSAAIFEMPIILDLRRIDLLQYPSDDFKLLLARRQALAVESAAPPCAFVARDDGSFAMLRIFTNYAEARGYRRENLSIVTTEIAEGIAWIYPQLDKPQKSQASLLQDIKRLNPDLC